METGDIYKTCTQECQNFKIECGMSPKFCTAKFFDFLDEETPSCEFAPEIVVEEEEE